jgi:diamine N-acetyltransferase
MKGNKVWLRSPEPEDIDYIYNLENNPEIWHLGDTCFPFSKFDIQNYILTCPKDIYKQNQLRLMIVKLSDNKTIGTVDLFDLQPYNRRVALGIIIEETERRKGFASDTLDITVSYCLDQLSLHQVYAGILESNISSTKLFERKGFVLSGRQKDWVLINNRWEDLLFYQLINPHEMIEKS